MNQPDFTRIRQAVHCLDNIERAGLTRDFEAALTVAFDQERLRRIERCIGDKIRAASIGARIAAWLNEDKSTCQQIAESYLCGDDSVTAFAVIREFGERAKLLLNRRAAG